MQSLKSRKGLEPTNGDGFGIGWYGKAAEPPTYVVIANGENEMHPFRPQA